MRVFRLLKDSPSYAAGTLYKESTYNGKVCYSVPTSNGKFPALVGSAVICHPDMVEKQPEWFVEVFQVLPEYATKEEIKALKKGK